MGDQTAGEGRDRPQVRQQQQHADGEGDQLQQGRADSRLGVLPRPRGRPGGPWAGGRGGRSGDPPVCRQLSVVRAGSGREQGFQLEPERVELVHSKAGRLGVQPGHQAGDRNDVDTTDLDGWQGRVVGVRQRDDGHDRARQQGRHRCGGLGDLVQLGMPRVAARTAS